MPASVIIPAGRTLAYFAVDPVDEFGDDGLRQVTITAFAAGYGSGRNLLTVFPGTGLAGAGVHGYDRSGDMNRHRDQGQIVIDSNVITNASQTGIRVDAGDRPVQFAGVTTSDLPHPGTVINFANRNTERWHRAW